MKKLLSIAGLSVLLLALSCESLLIPGDPASDPVANFEFLWREVDQKYAYFDYKSVDWDSVYSEYRPQVRADMSEQELFDLLAAMLNLLRDGHVNLTSAFDRSRNWSWYLDYPPNFNSNVVYRNYLADGYRISGPLHHQIIDSVLYVYYASFASEISQANLDALMDAAQGLKGVIIDIRGNGGGSGTNAYALASCFTADTLLYGWQRIKSGPGDDDFSPWSALRIYPRSGKRFDGQLVLLCNRNSYSAANLFAQMITALPHARLVGDQSGGGGGIPAFGELPNGWMYRFSATQTLTPQGEHTEGGIPVDIRVDMDPLDEAAGIDSIIESALELFRNS